MMMDEACNALDVCSADFFLAHMPESEPACREFIGKMEPHQLRVFWHPTGTNEPHRNFSNSGCCVHCQFRVSGENEGITFVTESEKSEGKYVRTVGKKTKIVRAILDLWVSVLGQPFGMDTICFGFCSYRYMCMKKKELLVEDNNSGPVGRVFNRGSPEYCASIDSYSREEFPMMNHAKFCSSYLALPVFECGQHKPCIGVLEFLLPRLRSLPYSDILKQLKGSDFEFTTSHPTACLQIDGNLLCGSYHYLRVENKTPLIQIWIPCYCDQTKRVTKLFCRWSSSSHWKYVHDSVFLNYGIHYVENGKGVVGRAFSQKMLCYFEDTSKFSISDYPLVHLTRTSGLTACLAIPAQSVHPKFSDMVVEIFLPAPPEKSFDGDYIDGLLKSLIPSNLAKGGEFCVQYSHSDAENYVYFDVSEKRRHVSPRKPLVDGREGCHFQPSPKEGNGQDHQIHAAALDKVEISSTSLMNGGDENRDGDQVQVHEIIESNRNEKQQLSSPVQPPATVSSGDSSVEIAETFKKFADAAEKFEGRLPPPKRKEVREIVPKNSTLPNKRARENVAADANLIPAASAKGKDIAAALDKVEISSKFFINGGDENRDGDQVQGHEILESNRKEKQHLSSPIQPPATASCGDSNVQEIAKTSRKFGDAAEKFEGRLPSQKRKEVHEIEPEIGTCPNKRARENVAADANLIPAASAKSKDITAGVVKIDRGYRIIVKATYKDDLVKFFLWSNSRIEELHKELHKRFNLEAEKFKVKYKDDEDNWVLLSCEEDLHFHLETSETPGQTGFKLLIIPLTD